MDKFTEATAERKIVRVEFSNLIEEKDILTVALMVAIVDKMKVTWVYFPPSVSRLSDAILRMMNAIHFS